ncbi:hypothetical protein BDR22DRAFT_486581 [Usnea florida]
MFVLLVVGSVVRRERQSVPLTTSPLNSINGFGLYRYAYRILMAVHLLLAALPLCHWAFGPIGPGLSAWLNNTMIRGTRYVVISRGTLLALYGHALNLFVLPACGSLVPRPEWTHRRGFVGVARYHDGSWYPVIRNRPRDFSG